VKLKLAQATTATVDLTSAKAPHACFAQKVHAPKITSVMTLLLFATSTVLLVKIGRLANKESAQNASKLPAQ
jgi:hypothetical protein